MPKLKKIEKCCVTCQHYKPYHCCLDDSYIGYTCCEAPTTCRQYRLDDDYKKGGRFYESRLDVKHDADE